MKSCEQMTEAVFQRVRIYEEKRRRLRRNVVRLVPVAACIGLVVLATQFNGLSTITPAAPGTCSGAPENSVSKVSSVLRVAFVSNNKLETSAMKTQIETQMRYRLFVLNLQGLTLAEKGALLRKEEAQLREKLSSFNSEIQNTPFFGRAGYSFNRSWENAAFIMFRGGGFQLDIDENAELESIEAVCDSVYGEAEFAIYSPNLANQSIPYRVLWKDGEQTEATKPVTAGGNVWLYAKGVTLGDDVYSMVREDEKKGKGGLYVRWKPSSLIYEVLNDNPAQKLSAFSDTMTINVRYKDGTQDEHTIGIVFYDDGNINAVYQGALKTKNNAS